MQTSASIRVPPPNPRLLFSYPFSVVKSCCTMPQLRIGISGWRYGPWRGAFYPKGLPQRRELEYVGSKMNSVEINGSFYSLQRPQSYRQWRDQVPPGFIFAVKGGRFITHMKKLRDIQTPLANFFASGLLELKDKLGPILWQFPPIVKYDRALFESFFELLPRDTHAAANLAKKHAALLKGRASTEADDKRELRHAIEIRNPTFLDKDFISLLRQHRIALVFADTARIWPYAEDITADFIYIRLHGAEQIYTSGYTDQALDYWAARIRLWSAGKEPPDAVRIAAPAPRRSARDVYIYFDNDRKVRAPFDALSLASRLISSPAA